LGNKLLFLAIASVLDFAPPAIESKVNGSWALFSFAVMKESFRWLREKEMKKL
jgi:hypothetical protein